MENKEKRKGTAWSQETKQRHIHSNDMHIYIYTKEKLWYGLKKPFHEKKNVLIKTKKI